MKNMISQFALGLLIFASAAGCGDSATSHSNGDVGGDHVHGENCEHGHTAEAHKGHVHTEECNHGESSGADKGHVHTDNCDHGHAHVKRDVKDVIAEKLSFLPDLLAVVDGKEIKRQDFVELIKKSVSPTQIVQFMSLSKRALKGQAVQFAKSEVEQIVMSKLAAEAGYAPSSEAVAKDFEKWLSTLTPVKMKQFEASLARQKTNLADYKKKMSEDAKKQISLAISKWIEEKVVQSGDKELSSHEKREMVKKVLAEGKKRFNAEVIIK